MRPGGWSLNPLDYIGQAAHTLSGGRIGYDADINHNVSYQGGTRNPAGGVNILGLGAQGAPRGSSGGGGGGGSAGHTANSPAIASSYYAGGGGGGGGSATASRNATAEQLAQYDQAIGQINHGLGRVDNQLGIALGNIGNEFNVKSNEIDGQLNRGKTQYGSQTTTNQQQRRTNINNIDDQSSGGLRGLQRLLGSRNAVGSDMTLAGRAVQNDANLKRSGAGQTYAQNQRSLDTNWGNFQNEIKDERDKLTGWRSNNENSARAQAAMTRQSLITQLAELNAQRAAAQGHNGADAARADLNRANALSAEIDNLARQNFTYTGKARNYTPASLDSYSVGGGVAAQLNPGDTGAGPDMSLYQYGRDDEDKYKKL